ncbi:HAD-IB family hydrolase [Ilumatobacter sp.]|uniref:HAD-IB family hydrolase n=1 Tax=Ilumatobacter sp. TaxID=1967498 RepID=UPI003B51B528
MRVAAFDVDGTLTTRDCVVPFMRRVSGARTIASRLGAGAHRLGPVVVRRDRDQLKALAAAAAFRGRRLDDLERLAREFAEQVHDGWLRPDTVEDLRDHVADGDEVVLVSASFELYLRPLATLLGAHAVLATRLEVRDGVATGALHGPNCRGPEKVRRLHEWIERHHGDRSRVSLVAYGDSAGDREMLADADVAHWVGRRGRAS